jgi:hypothetical protein
VADLVIDVDHLTPDAVAERIIDTMDAAASAADSAADSDSDSDAAPSNAE